MEFRMNQVVDIVLGIQSGDEAKGKICHELAGSGEYTHTMRFNGGCNAGHTIFHNGKKYVTHLVPAGIFWGLPSIIGGGCVVDVDKFLKEVNELSKDFDTSVIKICKNAHLITAQHVREERSESKIGTTKTGNGPAYRDKASRVGIRAESDPRLKDFLIDPYDWIWSGEKNKTVLMEGAQGFGLDIDWGDYPYVSSSSCSVSAAVAAGFSPKKIRKIIGAAKPYETYVGSKSFGGTHPELAKLQQIGAEVGATTGRARQCNWMNLQQMIRAVNTNGVTELILNKFDVFTQANEYRLFDSCGCEMTFGKNIESFVKHVERKLIDNCRDLENIVWSTSPEKI